MENKTEKAGSSKLKTIIIFILVLAVVGAGVFIGYNKFLKKGNNNSNVQNQAVQTSAPQAQSQGQSSSDSSYLSQVVSSKTFQLDEITVNLSDQDAKRYLKADVYLGYDEKKLTDELTDKKPVVMDAVIGILSSKKASEIVPKNMDNIKMQIIQKINPMLEDGKLSNVYFTNLIVQ